MTTIPKEIAAAYRTDVERAIKISKEEGCEEIYLFGSVATGKHGPDSDLDIAVRGCPPARFYPLLGRLLDELSHSVDLVDLDVEIRVADFLRQEGQLIHVG